VKISNSPKEFTEFTYSIYYENRTQGTLKTIKKEKVQPVKI